MFVPVRASKSIFSSYGNKIFILFLSLLRKLSLRVTRLKNNVLNFFTRKRKKSYSIFHVKMFLYRNLQLQGFFVFFLNNLIWFVHLFFFIRTYSSMFKLRSQFFSTEYLCSL